MTQVWLLIWNCVFFISASKFFSLYRCFWKGSKQKEGLWKPLMLTAWVWTLDSTVEGKGEQTSKIILWPPCPPPPHTEVKQQTQILDKETVLNAAAGLWQQNQRKLRAKLNQCEHLCVFIWWLMLFYWNWVMYVQLTGRKICLLFLSTRSVYFLNVSFLCFLPQFLWCWDYRSKPLHPATGSSFWYLTVVYYFVLPKVLWCWAKCYQENNFLEL